MYIVSACLLGHNCKYNGDNNLSEPVVEFCKTHKHMAVCPERAAGLPAPRDPAEKVGNKILSKNGKDVTEPFLKGARDTLAMCMKMAEYNSDEIQGAILKANSPSCGFGKIYDGTFSGVLIDGDGVFASMVSQMGIEVITEKEKIKW